MLTSTFSTHLPYNQPFAFPTSSPSPSAHSYKQQRSEFPFHGLSNEISETGRTPEPINSTPYSGYQPMPVQSSTPQIRLQRPSGAPQLSHEKSSPSQNSMLSEQYQEWPPRWSTYEEGFQGMQIGAQKLPRQGRRLSSHRRNQSASSNGSRGPNSPLNSTTSHPSIVQQESHFAPGFEAADYSTFGGFDVADQHTSFDFSKGTLKQENINPFTTHNNIGGKNMIHNRRLANTASEQEEPPALSPGRNHRQNLSSVQSTTSGEFHSPPTPHTTGDDFDNMAAPSTDYRSVPKFDRSLSDVFQDELYNPTMVSQPQQQTYQSQVSTLSPHHRNNVQAALQAANNQRLSAQSQNESPRERSPFNQNSPFAGSVHSFGSHPSPHVGSAAQLRESQQAENQAAVLRQQMEREAHSNETPKTISPKDAVLDYHESEEESNNMPLFPIDDNMSEQNYNLAGRSQRGMGYPATSMPTSAAFQFSAPTIAGNIQVPNQYPFVGHQRFPSNTSNYRANEVPRFPPSLPSMESSMSDFDHEEVSKPESSRADSGTYTCTYHGCPLRFETPAKLQKHKREGHRQLPATTPLSSHGLTPEGLERNTQAGPHRCDRINPQTGKPCATIFSRPYDLTRHEDTIHNARKQKVRCQYCTEEKSFSRNDALTRHMRVVHPEIDFPGKTRRKNLV